MCEKLIQSLAMASALVEPVCYDHNGFVISSTKALQSNNVMNSNSNSRGSSNNSAVDSNNAGNFSNGGILK